jgi:hypothetical protein
MLFPGGQSFIFVFLRWYQVIYLSAGSLLFSPLHILLNPQADAPPHVPEAFRSLSVDINLPVYTFGALAILFTVFPTEILKKKRIGFFHKHLRKKCVAPRI